MLSGEHAPECAEAWSRRVASAWPERLDYYFFQRIGTMSVHAFGKGAFGLGLSRAYVDARRRFESGPVIPSARRWCGWLEAICDVGARSDILGGLASLLTGPLSVSKESDLVAWRD